MLECFYLRNMAYCYSILDSFLHSSHHWFPAISQAFLNSSDRNLRHSSWRTTHDSPAGKHVLFFYLFQMDADSYEYSFIWHVLFFRVCQEEAKKTFHSKRLLSSIVHTRSDETRWVKAWFHLFEDSKVINNAGPRSRSMICLRTNW